MAGNRKKHPNRKEREKRREKYAELFNEGFTMGYSIGYDQARMDLEKQIIRERKMLGSFGR